jgi:methylthioribose-1-phosphate isomerase
METVDHVRLSDDARALVILDQRALPLHRRYLTLTEPEAMYDAIRSLAVRGAPAIGIFAGFAMFVLAQRLPPARPAFDRAFQKTADYLDSARPTAVNLGWALRRMGRVLRAHPGADVPALLPLLRAEAQAILEEDIAMCRAVSEHGLSLLRDGDTVLTHCNAGPIATSRYGTALGPLILGAERGYTLHAFVDETRPLLQGARLTSWELQNAGVDVTLICDNMAGLVMRQGRIDACFVGCDRVAANGDTANKIGTGSVAVLAHYYGVPFYVLGPTSSVDMTCPTGGDIPIEERDGDEIRTKWYAEPMAPAGVRCYNPAFDVTDHSLISGIVTEKGICRPPFPESLQKLFAEGGA